VNWCGLWDGGRFIGQLLKLLVCNNEKFGPQIQKHVKELVGHELNSHIYPILFDRCKAFVDKFFDTSGQVTRRFLSEVLQNDARHLINALALESKVSKVDVYLYSASS